MGSIESKHDILLKWSCRACGCGTMGHIFEYSHFPVFLALYEKRLLLGWERWVHINFPYTKCEVWLLVAQKPEKVDFWAI